jgi:hypothetical protein
VRTDDFRVAARIDDAVVVRAALLGALLALDTVFFFDPLFSGVGFAVFLDGRFLETLFGRFRAAAFRDGVFFPEACFLRVLAAIDLRDLPLAARFPLAVFFCFLAAAPFTGMRSRLQDSPNEVGDYTCADRQRKPSFSRRISG